jgi:putative flippase GtrA
MRAEFTRYVGAGLVNTAVGYLVFLAVLHLAHAPPLVANIASYAVGLCVAYLLNLVFVFRGARHSGTALGRFLSGAALAWLINAAVLETGIRVLRLAPELAQLIAMAAYTVSFYLINRHLVWARA